jgi:hypothetical protein
MIANSRRPREGNVRAAAVLAGLLLSSCVPQYSSPQQVQASNPSVTYTYRSDQDLVQTNQTAATFCSRYQSVPRAANFTNNPDGSKAVIFECVPTIAPVAPSPQFNPNVAYNYRTDQELLDASRNAQIYCMNNGSPQTISNIVTNSDGSKTVTFQCSSR